MLLLVCFSCIYFLPGLEKGGSFLINSSRAQSAKPSADRVNYLPEDIVSLIRKSERNYYTYGRLVVADSLAVAAVNLASQTYRPEVILFSLNHYMSMNELGYNIETAADYALKAERLVFLVDDPELVWQSYVNIAYVWLTNFDYDKALSFAHRALAAAEAARSQEMKAGSFLCIGAVLQGKSEFIEAFRYLMQALTIAESLKEKSLLKECYRDLGRFYQDTKNYEKAVSYKMMEIDLIQNQKTVDSVALVWAWCYLEELSMTFGNTLHEDKVCEIISFADRHRISYMKQYIMAMYRVYLMDNNKFDRLRNLYLEKYPEELDYMKKNLPLIYNRLKAIFYEVEGKIDSAHIYYRKALALVEKNTNQVMVANFHIRYGEFLQRQGRAEDAIAKYLVAFRISEEVNYPDYTLKSSRLLLELYKSTGDFENALFFSEKEKLISERLDHVIRNDELLALEIQNAAQLREIALQQEQLEKRRRYNIQYTLMVLMIIVLFINLIILGSFRVSPTMIHLLGLVSFVFLFEFIILFADNFIHRITHGEPLKVIAIKIVLIGFILPLHHWVHKKATHSLVKGNPQVRRGLGNLLARIRHTAREIWIKWE